MDIEMQLKSLCGPLRCASCTANSIASMRDGFQFGKYWFSLAKQLNAPISICRPENKGLGVNIIPFGIGIRFHWCSDISKAQTLSDWSIVVSGFLCLANKISKRKRKAKLSRIASFYALNAEQKRKANLCVSVCAIRSHGIFRQIPWIFYAPGVSSARICLRVLSQHHIAPKVIWLVQLRWTSMGPVTLPLYANEWM